MTLQRKTGGKIKGVVLIKLGTQTGATARGDDFLGIGGGDRPHFLMKFCPED